MQDHTAEAYNRNPKATQVRKFAQVCKEHSPTCALTEMDHAALNQKEMQI